MAVSRCFGDVSLAKRRWQRVFFFSSSSFPMPRVQCRVPDTLEQGPLTVCLSSDILNPGEASLFRSSLQATVTVRDVACNRPAPELLSTGCVMIAPQVLWIEKVSGYLKLAPELEGAGLGSPTPLPCR